MTTQTPPAGWYADPLSADAHRYWDGSTWTEHTSPAAAAATAPAASTPATSATSATSATTQVPAQQMPAQVPRQQAYAGPQSGTGAPSPAPEPYAYSVGSAGPVSGMQAQRIVPHLYPPQPGRSTGVKVLIGVGIALGALLILCILAAIAIPVFLNQRAKAAGPIALPQAAAGLVRSAQPDTSELTKTWLSAPVPGKKSAAFYDTADGQRRALVLVSQVNAAPDDRSDFLRGVEDEAADNGITDFRPVDTAAGQLSCGSAANGGGTICAFASRRMVGTINVIGAGGEDVAVGLYDAINRSGS